MIPDLIRQIIDQFNFDIDPQLTREENAEEIIRSASLLAGAIAVQPIPFADIILITPVQAKMVLHLGKLYGYDLTPERTKAIVAQLGATVAYGFAARQVMRGLAKIALPMIGGLITAPAVYGWTYGLGRLAQNYFERKSLGLAQASQKEQRQLAAESQKEAKQSLPSTQDFSDLASELRRRAEQKKD